MRIYSMTATFGKLQHETLTLQPGLNILEAPNEWGKSTWCAFLAAMLYGMDTRAKTTKTALADKERFAPWSGTPMAGRMDICWNGRDITIERSTKRRVPLGEFKAYETQTGIAVPELTAANCGEMLLGVEQSVFRRAGFIRFSDLPVTQDDALRRRLNALVTTGDEHGDGEQLSRELRDLKNRCRYNRSGLLPQAEEERRVLAGKLRDLEDLELQSLDLKQRLEALSRERAQLENHRVALAYAASQEDARRLEQARMEMQRSANALARLEQEVAGLPGREQTQQKLQQLQNFSRRWRDAQLERHMLPPDPVEPVIPQLYLREDSLQADTAEHRRLQRSRELPWYVAAAVFLLGAIGLAVARLWIWAAVAAVAAAVPFALGLWMRGKRIRGRLALEEKYGAADPAVWWQRFDGFAADVEAYRTEAERCRTARRSLEERLQELLRERADLCADREPEAVEELCQQVLILWDDHAAARRDAQRSHAHFEALRAVVRTAKAPEEEDLLRYSEADTRRLLENAAADQHLLQNRLGNCQGRMDALGQGEQLQRELDRVNDRISKLEDFYGALTIAQETLTAARQELQRRFAPRIAKRAQELMASFTGGRYDRLTLGEDLSLNTGAGEEDTLHGAQWRSDGTVDQLYLALRLAVAEELAPDAPIILDDALVRFDDDRLKAVLRALRKEAEHRQVLLFTCQSRERTLLEA